MAGMTPDRLIGSQEAAQLLHCSVRTLHRWVGAGKLPAQKLPGETGAYLFRVEDLDALKVAS